MLWQDIGKDQKKTMNLDNIAKHGSEDPACLTAQEVRMLCNSYLALRRAVPVNVIEVVNEITSEIYNVGETATRGVIHHNGNLAELLIKFAEGIMKNA